MRELILSFCFLLFGYSLLAQPESFSWADRHNDGSGSYYNYISPIKNQEDNGPCNIFASIAAVEAMTQIYFNKESPVLDLAESNIYNNDCGLCGTTAFYALSFIKNNGVVNETCFPYVNNCDVDCDNICPDPLQLVTIPDFGSQTVSNVTDLKLLLMNKGPLVANISGGSAVLHGGTGVDHAVLLIGWKYDENNNLLWELKDSWPSDKAGTTNFDLVAFNILQYCSTFFFVNPIYNSNFIECDAGVDGLDCSLFSRATPVDNDGDGFFNWGWDFASKPSGASYPDLMDFNDGDDSKIYRSGDTIYPAPEISGTSGKVCQSGGNPSGYPFALNNVPPGFSCS